MINDDAESSPCGLRSSYACWLICICATFAVSFAVPGARREATSLVTALCLKYSRLARANANASIEVLHPLSLTAPRQQTLPVRLPHAGFRALRWIIWRITGGMSGIPQTVGAVVWWCAPADALPAEAAPWPWLPIPVDGIPPSLVVRIDSSGIIRFTLRVTSPIPARLCLAGRGSIQSRRRSTPPSRSNVPGFHDCADTALCLAFVAKVLLEFETTIRAIYHCGFAGRCSIG